MRGNSVVGIRFATALAVIALSFPIHSAAAAASEPAIQIINPSTGAVISSAATGSDENPEAGDEMYRLNAWVKNAPNDPIVEFELDGSSGTMALGTAKEVASDTFELLWSVDDVSSGEYTLRAFLYGGSEQVGVAEREVQIAEPNPVAPATAATADITYPTNGGKAGFFTNIKDNATNIVMDVEYSAGTSSVATFYATSPVGDEPEWNRCGVVGVSTLPAGPPGEVRLECALGEDAAKEQVTGVAAVANLGSSRLPFTEILSRGGDAVRVFPYAQDPTFLEIDGATQSLPGDEGEPPFGCSEEIVLIVLDQIGRLISAAPVDVHASGPTDDLRFAGSFGPNGSAPDENHGDHQEQARDCAPGGFLSGSQGDHNRPGGADRKHLESTTDVTGSWSVQLWSNDRGVSGLTFWADEDDNDLFCSSEPAAAASVGWGQQVGGATNESPEQTGCEPPKPSSPAPDPPPAKSGCTIKGTSDEEKIVGTSGDDVLCGRGGDDRISGRGGDDVIKGGPGDDKLRGGPGADSLNGGPGDDSLNGGGGQDACRGGPGADRMRSC